MTITDVVNRIRGKFPESIWMAKEYSKADMIEDLLEIEQRLTKKKKLTIKSILNMVWTKAS